MTGYVALLKCSRLSGSSFPASIKCLTRLVSLLHSYLPRTGELDVGISTGLSTCIYCSEDGPEEDLGMAIADLGSLGL